MIDVIVLVGPGLALLPDLRPLVTSARADQRSRPGIDPAAPFFERVT
ncbi:hypothetical protein [Streptomyces sp. Tue6028]